MVENRKKVAIMRGKNLNKWDMQMYEPLAEHFDVTVFKHPRNRFDTGDIQLPILELSDVANVFHKIAHPLARLGRSGKDGAQQRSHFYPGSLRKHLAGFDIVHVAETYTNYAHTAAQLKSTLGFRLITTVRENIPFRSMNRPHEQATRPHVVPMVDKFVAVTELTRQTLRLENIPEEKISVIYPGIDTTLFKPGARDYQLLNRLGCDRHELILLFVGRLIYKKGIFVLLEAVRMLKERERQLKFKCIIVGAGKEEKKVEKLIGLYGLRDRFVLAGKWRYQDLPHLYNIADALVVPSIPTQDWQEQFGMVYAEAMACKKPVVSTHSGAIPEVVGEGGLFTVPDSAPSLSDALRRLLLDESLRNTLAENGYKRARENFDRQKQAEKLEEIYCSVLEMKSPRRTYEKKVSVIIPVYNRANIITNALESIREQAGVDQHAIEIICIDDGSTDELAEVLRKFPEVHLMRIPHRGLVGLVRNEGLKIAHGELITYLDSDDRWHKHHLRTILEAFHHDARLCFVATRAEYEHVEILADRLRVLKRGRPAHRSALITGCVAHKKICTDEIGGFDDADFAEDRHLWNKIMLNYPSKRIKKVTTVFRYIKKGNNLSYRFEELRKKYHE